MDKKRLKSITLVGALFLLPVILYWGVKIKESIVFHDYSYSFWLMAFFPWGLIISAILIPLSIGMIKLKNFWRKATIVIASIYIPFIFIMPFLIMDWFFRGTLIYAIFLIVYLTRPKVKEQFK